MTVKVCFIPPVSRCGETTPRAVQWCTQRRFWGGKVAPALAAMASTILTSPVFVAVAGAFREWGRGSILPSGRFGALR